MTDLSFLSKEKLHTGFGEVITNPTSYEDILHQAGLDWTVSAHDAYTKVNDSMIQIPKTKVIFRDADSKSLGIVSDKYKIVQNSDAFDFTKTLFGDNSIEFIRGGSYRGGSATWLEAKITGQFSILGDEFECYLIFMNTHDGTGSIRCMILPERIVCSNALNVPLKNVLRNWRCVHSGDPLAKIDEARQILLAGSSYMDALESEIEDLQKIKLSSTQVETFIDKIFPLPIDKTTNTIDTSSRAYENALKRRDQLLDIYTDKPDLANLGNSGYKFISAVTDFVDHVNTKNTANGALNTYMKVANGHPIVDLAYNMVKAA